MTSLWKKGKPHTGCIFNQDPFLTRFSMFIRISPSFIWSVWLGGKIC